MTLMTDQRIVHESTSQSIQRTVRNTFLSVFILFCWRADVASVCSSTEPELTTDRRTSDTAQGRRQRNVSQTTKNQLWRRYN